MDKTGPTLIKAKPLTADAYRPYGDVLAASDGLPFSPANLGTAKRFNFLSDARNLRGDKARLNLCIFRCSPLPASEMPIKMMEKHPFSTQAFLPMHDGTYITVVALGDAVPDLTSLKAFVVKGPQGITYHPGIWHYPMSVIGKQLDMACIVYEDGSEDDCAIANLVEPVLVQI